MSTLDDLREYRRAALERHLRKEIEGEICFDDTRRKLYATDASRLPEAYFVAATLHRAALGAALSELVEFGALSWDEAAGAGRAVLAGNAVSLYQLPPC